MGKITEKLSDKSALPWWAIALGVTVLLMFVANGAMVWLSSHGNRDLVRTDYYDAGLEQDKSIARTQLGHKIEIKNSLEMGESYWSLVTDTVLLKSAQGTVHLYRPDNRKEDTVLTLESSLENEKMNWKFKSLHLRQGKWIANFIWTDKNQPIAEKSYQLQF